MSQHDDHDDLAALDFSAHRADPDDAQDSDALDFSVTEDNEIDSAVDAFDDFTPAEPEIAELDALAATTAQADAAGDGDEDDGVSLFTVTNPPATVSVSALIDGRTQRVHLSPKATALTESELADEILVLADLARQKGLAGQHTYLMENAIQSQGLQQLDEIGFDANQVLRDFMEHDMHLSTPEQAEAAQAEVFATRYAADQ